jgi:hypothetical protein
MNSGLAGPRYHPSRASLTGVGLPGDRMARMAARRAFLDLRATYLQAIEPLPGPRADWLRNQVRRAQEPADLWMLRAAVFEALPAQSWRAQRERLQHSIDSMFPRTAQDSGFSSLF